MERIHPMFYAGMARVDRREVLAKVLEEENLPLVFSMADADDDEVLRVMKIVSDYFKISLEDMTGKSRLKEVIQARHWAMFLAYDLFKQEGLSLQRLGTYFSYRGLKDGVMQDIVKDHATVLNAYNKIRGYIDTYPEEAATYKVLLNLI